MDKTGVLPINLFQIHFSFNEPVQASVNLAAETEEEAVKKLSEEMEKFGTNLEILGIEDLGEYRRKEEAPPVEEELELPDNVLAFPTHKTKQ